MRKLLFRIDCISLLVVLLLFSSGCGRTKVIPDDELGDIFRDIYIANAYQSINYKGVDTIDLYGPILDGYGYDINDFKGTMLGFTKHKNAKLSLIIEDAIRQIDTKFYSLEGGIEQLDSIEARSKRMLQSVLIENRRIEVRSIDDTTKLVIELDVKPGSYFITYIADVDSIDSKKAYRGTHYLRDSSDNNLNYDNFWFSGERKRYSTEIVADSNARKLVLNLGNYTKKMKKPSLVIDSLRIIYELPGKQAIDSIHSVFIKRIFIDGTEWAKYTQDSVSLHLPTSGLSPEGGDNSQ